METFLAEQDGSPSLDSLITEAVAGNTKALEDQLIGFFSSVRVTNPQTKAEELPKRNTFDAYLSHISTTILGKSNGRVDIKNAAVFKEFFLVLDGMKKTLKSEGKGDVDHYEGAPELLFKITSLITG